MVALKREREQRHYPMGPTSCDVPLKLYKPPAKQVPWWVDILLAAGFVVVVLVDVAAVVIAWGAW